MATNIDKVLVNHDFLDKFLDITITTLLTNIGDHTLVFITFKQGQTSNTTTFLISKQLFALNGYQCCVTDGLKAVTYETILVSTSQIKEDKTEFIQHCIHYHIFSAKLKN